MSALQHSIEQFLYHKAQLCDQQDWDAYLDLFDEQSEFHLPQWESEHSYTTDPKRGMSLIYYANRSGLEDRVFRLRTGKSAASTPMPRTLHQISNVGSSPLIRLSSRSRPAGSRCTRARGCRSSSTAT